MQSNCIFNRTIFAALHEIYLDIVYDEVIVQQLSGFLGDIGHFVKTMSRFNPQPFVHLIASKCLIPLRNKEFPQLIFC